MNSPLAVSGKEARRRFGRVSVPDCNFWLEAMYLRALLQQQRLLLTLMVSALLLSVTSAQGTAQLPLSSTTDPAADLRCSGGNCRNRSKEHIPLARVVSALRQSEALTAQLRLDLTEALVEVVHGSDLVAVEARNACNAQTLELRTNTDATDRLAASVSQGFRKAEDERAALQRWADGAEERLQLQGAALHGIERTINETRSEVNATSSNIITTKLDLERLSDKLGYLRDDLERLIVEVRNMSAQLRECPNGWLRNGSWCYFLVDFSDTWRNSRGQCKILNADLVTINSSHANAFLSDYVTSFRKKSGEGAYGVWLGGTDVKQEGVWMWVTGELFYIRSQSGKNTFPGIYSNFMNAYPNNNFDNRRDPANCLAMHGNGGWSDMPCNRTMPFFCQMYRP